ncbi:MAG: hypothetical protein M1814_006342 [Vezdaea aestivalis]|nr:MAG: hypothetical protein M1814_006342 [Vezdaea aestivalis]
MAQAGPADLEEPCPSSPPHGVMELSSTVNSPPSSAPKLPRAIKVRKPPPITPNSFHRFFTPSTRATRSSVSSRAHRALRDITGTQSSKPCTTPQSSSRHKGLATSANATPPSTKRKAKSCDDSSPTKPRKRRCSIRAYSSPTPETDTTTRAIERENEQSVASQILQRSFGQRCRISRFTDRAIGADWRPEVADFATAPEDTFQCLNVSGTPAIPFSSASSNTTSLVALGLEDGYVRLVDTARDARAKFDETFLALQFHPNAIMDVQFSPDDHLLATASADLTSMIIDVPTQRAVTHLVGHTGSVKRVRFQPGSGGNVLATASRDGSVKIWDLRVSYPTSVQTFNVLPGPRRHGFDYPIAKKAVNWVNDIEKAHVYGGRMPTFARRSRKTKKPFNPLDEPPMNRTCDSYTLTAMAFLPPGRDHLLITACGLNTQLRLWDTRTVYTNRQSGSLPVSTTEPAKFRPSHRSFGTNAIVVNAAGTRLFSLCRDNTVYAYSAQHLITGHAPDLAANSDQPRSFHRGSQKGLGPLYGLQHPKLHTGSYFVNMALRPSADGQSELLATGSSEGTPIVFPVDERYTYRSHSTPNTDVRTPSSKSNDVPVYKVGTALVRGHSKEVSHVAWTEDGSLVSVSDDQQARCWRESAKAKDLRLGGEKDGRRWQCGWSETGPEAEEEDLD